jgi:hypothetical protein
MSASMSAPILAALLIQALSQPVPTPQPMHDHTILADSSHGTATARAAGLHGPDGTLASLMAWIAGRFDLPLTQEHPRIAFAGPDALAALRFRGFAVTDANTAGRMTVALYSDAERTIYLPDDWDGTSPAAMSVLVHELVHHMQNVAGLKFNCPAERENIAYRAQSAWLIQNGSSLDEAFQIDAFSLLVKTNCMS